MVEDQYGKFHCIKVEESMTDTKHQLEKDGIEFIPNLFDENEIKAILSECDSLFSKSTISGPIYSVFINQNLKEIPHPIATIKSVNLLEKVETVFLYLEKKANFRDLNLKLAHFALYSESDNHQPLRWHSDTRSGNLVRVQICLRGGNTDLSGAFKYVVGSHKFKDIQANPPDSGILQFQELIIKNNFPNGTATLINTLGYHAKSPCINERISIMMDFLPLSHINQ